MNDERDRHRLIRFYQRYNPTKLSTINATLQQYTGDREALFKQLVAKYGPEPPTEEEHRRLDEKEFQRQRLIRFYEKYNPDKLSSVDATLDAFESGGRGYEDLFRQLVGKYGPEPTTSSQSAPLPSSPSPFEQNGTNPNNNFNNDQNNNNNNQVVIETAVPVADGTYPPTFSGQRDPSPHGTSQQRQHQHDGISSSSHVADYSTQEQFRNRLIRYWERYDPSRISQEIERTLVQYQNREEELFRSLVQTYGAEPPRPNPAANVVINNLNRNHNNSNQNNNAHHDPVWGEYGGGHEATTKNNFPQQEEEQQQPFSPLNINYSSMPALNGHTTCVCGNSLVVYGGLKDAHSNFNGDVFALDLDTFEWSRVETSNGIIVTSNNNTNNSSVTRFPPPRAFHTSVMVDNRMFVFGGLTAVGIEDVHYNMHNVFAHPDVLIAENARFQVPHNARDRLIKNCGERWPFTQPKPGIAVGNNTATRSPTTSLFILEFGADGGANTWCVAATSGNEPSSRAHHAATLWNGDQMLVYGGYSVYGQGLIGDPDSHACAALYSLNVHSLFWRRIETCHSPWPARWGCANAANTSFVDSTSSSSSSSIAPKWFFVGGVDPSIPGEVDDVFALDLKRREWKKVQRPDPDVTFGPDSIALHAAVSFGGKLYILGGSCRYSASFYQEAVMKAMDQRTGAWETVTDVNSPSFAGSTHDCPSPRSGHTATLVGSELFVFGGLTSTFSHFADNTLRSNEVFRFNFLTKQWRRIECGGFGVSKKQKNDGDDDDDGVPTSTAKKSGKRMVGVSNVLEDLMDLSRQLMEEMDQKLPTPPPEPEPVVIEEQIIEQQEPQVEESVVEKAVNFGKKTIFGDKSKEETAASTPNFDEKEDKTDEAAAATSLQETRSNKIPFDQQHHAEKDDNEEVENLKRQIEEMKKSSEENENLQLKQKDDEIANMKKEMEEMRIQMMNAKVVNSPPTATAAPAPETTTATQEESVSTVSSPTKKVFGKKPPVVAEAVAENPPQTQTQAQPETQKQSQQQQLQQQQVTPTPLAASTSSESNLPPQINDKDRQRLRRYYQKYNPEKVPEVDLALARYEGQVERMFQVLIAKYGPEPPEDEKSEQDAGRRDDYRDGGGTSNIANTNDRNDGEDDDDDGGGEPMPSPEVKRVAGKLPSPKPGLAASKSPGPKPASLQKSPTPPAKIAAKKSPTPVALTPSPSSSPPTTIPSPTATSSASIEDQIREIITKHEPKLVPALPALLKKLKDENKEQAYLNMMKKKHLTAASGESTPTVATSATSTPTPAAAAAKKSPVPPGNGAATTTTTTTATKSPPPKPAAGKAPARPKEEIEKDIKALLEKHEPKLVPALPAIMKKAEGKEQAYLNMLKKKYEGGGGGGEAATTSA